MMAGASLLKSNELLALAKINDRVTFYPTCDVSAAAGLLLNFEEYDRTGAEKLGGVYTGTGPREVLGLAATDELGNYVFRFSRSLSDIANETLDVGAGELLATQIFPDVIVQAIGTGMQVDYESAPYYNIPNLYRIDLCLPYGIVHPSTGACDAFDRTIVKIGDIIVLNSALSGTPNTMDGTGRLTCRNANAPLVDCAAWRGALRVYACLPAGVTWYSMRYQRVGIDPSFQPVGEQFKLNHIPDFAVGYTGTIVGSTLRSVQVGGGAPVMHPVYDNHQGDSNWIENDLKLILTSSFYTGPSLNGSVDFKIEGYDATGKLVAGTADTLRLYLDNKLSTGSIKNVNVSGALAPDDCALITLPSASAPITVQYTIDNPEGFLASWALSVKRGNNVNVPVTPSGVIPASFPAPTPPGPVDPCAFHGSQDYALDVDGFTDTVLVPSPAGTTWLPAGKTFCAFAFTLTANDRVTDGRTGYPQTVFWQDLVGLNI